MCSVHSRDDPHGHASSAVLLAASFPAGKVISQVLAALQDIGVGPASIGLLATIRHGPSGVHSPAGETPDLRELTIAAGLLPGLGSVLAGGMLATPLAKASASRSIADDAISALRMLGIPSGMAQTLASVLESGDVVLVVQPARFRTEVERILAEQGGRLLSASP